MEKLIDFNTATSLLSEGDVLLFKGRTLSSFFIKRAGEGQYSHVGVASAVGDNGGKIWECIEFREWKGGRSVNLELYAQNNIIDVYRPVSSIKRVIFDGDSVKEINVKFDGKKVTNTMRKMTGLPYGWKRIWYIAKYKLFFIRMFYSIEDLVNDMTPELIYPVCSTAVSYSFFQAGYDLIHHRSDNAMEPSDVARSPLLFHIFSIGPIQTG